jgi:hypothetical protein
MARTSRRIPFEFVLDALESTGYRTKPFFGCTSVYVDEKIVLVLREKDSAPNDNGVWVATTVEHHETLRKELPSLRSIAVFGPGTTGWQLIPVDSPTFESEAIRASELVVEGDSRIGKVPAARRTKNPTKLRRPRKRR